MRQFVKLISCLAASMFLFSCNEKIDVPGNEPELPVVEQNFTTVTIRLDYSGRTGSENETLLIFNSVSGRKAEVAYVQNGMYSGFYTAQLDSASRYDVYAIARAAVKNAGSLTVDSIKDLQIDWTGENAGCLAPDTLPLFFCETGITLESLQEKYGKEILLNIQDNLFTKVSLTITDDNLTSELFSSKVSFVTLSGITKCVLPFASEQDRLSTEKVSLNLTEENGRYTAYIPYGLASQGAFGASLHVKAKYEAIRFPEKYWANPVFSFELPSEGLTDGKDYSLAVRVSYDYPDLNGVLYESAAYTNGYREKKTFRFLDGKGNHLGYNIPWGDNDFTLQGTYNPDGVGSGSGDDIRWAQNADFLSRAQFKTLNTGIETYRFWTDFYNGCGMKCSACGHETYGYPYDSASQAERSHWIQMFTSAWATYPVFNCSRCGALFGDISAGDTQFIENGKPGQTGHNLVYTEGRSVVKLQLPYIFLEAGEQCPVWFEDTSTGCKDTVWVSVGRFEDQVFYMKDPHRFYVGQKIEVNWDDKDQPIMWEFLIGEESAKYAGGGGGQIFFSLLSEGRFVVEFTDPMTEKRIGRFALKVKEPVLSGWNAKVEL